MISAVEEIAYDTIRLVNTIKHEMQSMKKELRDNYKFYSQDLLNHLYKQPYTKIEFLMSDLNVSRVTASGYLNLLSKNGVLLKHKMGNANYYINTRLMLALGMDGYDKK